MNETAEISSQLSHFKEVLTRLPATGLNGFEGLMASVLGAIVGVPFRLSAAGTQFGIDGQTIYDTPGISFESKLYTGSVQSSEVMAKIGELAVDSRNTELWILAATSQISAQLAKKLSAFASRSVVSTLILDWSTNSLAPLPVLLSMASDETRRFLAEHPNTANLSHYVNAGLNATQNHDQYSTHVTQLREVLLAPTLGMDASLKANAEWLNDALADVQIARRKFRQPLSPFDPSKGQPYFRAELVHRVHEFLQAPGNARALYVLGDEGSGKSWLIAQSWHCLHRKPIFLFLTTEQFVNSTTTLDVQEILISALIRQTGDYNREGLREKWQNILRRWRNVSSEYPRLIVLTDGLNQSREKDWARIVAALAEELATLSGRLILTVRTQFYRTHIERRSATDHSTVEVGEWTAAERNKILGGRSIDGSTLSRNVANSLCNPRLLGIALDLLTNEEIIGLEELNVSRLLFEHILASEVDSPDPQPAHEFVNQLRSHAEEVLERISRDQGDDITVFENFLGGHLGAVVDGRFFRHVEGDPTRYQLDDSGLTLALGFAVLDRLRRAHRNGHDLRHALAVIAEPITSLDLTAGVFVAALMTGCVHDGYNHELATVLLEAISDLQNPADDDLNQLGNLARVRLDLFADVAYNLCIATNQRPSHDTIVTPLLYACSDEKHWRRVFQIVGKWLSIYSVSPERGLFLPSTSEERVHYQTKYENHRESIQTAVASLSDTEKMLLAELREVDESPNPLSELAFSLLAGKPLVEVAPVFVKWLFSSSLVSDHMIPYRDLYHLIRLNNIDWASTRAVLLREADVFRQKDVSVVGRRTLVNILASTGGIGDARKAFLLSEELRGDRELPGSWRLVETYCSVDPCDPGSERPDNVSQTACDYARIDVSKVRMPNGNEPITVFFDTARCAMARFEPALAADKHKSFARHVTNRSGVPLFHGAFELRTHNALLGRESALRLTHAAARASEESSDLGTRDIRHTRQMCLALSFPFLTAREQFELLVLLEMDGMLLDLLAAIKPLDKRCFEELLEKACADRDEHRLYVLLLMANRSAACISERAWSVAIDLVDSETQRLRSEALGVVARHCDPEAVRHVACGDWRAEGTSRSDESRYGSRILIEAVLLGFVGAQEALCRMSPTYYPAAARRWEQAGFLEAVECAARFMQTALNGILGLEDHLSAPDIELHVRHVEDEAPVVNLGEREMYSGDPLEGLRLATESDEQRLYRHEKNWESFDALKQALGNSYGRVLLDHVDLEGFRVLLENDKTFAHESFESLSAVGSEKLAKIHNIVLQLAHALGHQDPETAASLFRETWRTDPLVRIRYGIAQLPLDAIALWSGAESETLDRLRILRLEQATDDQELAEQVLAAHIGGKKTMLEEYIKGNMDTGEPAAIARSIMIAGYSDCSAFNEGVLEQYKNCHGFIGNAYMNAKYSYERNEWARHWYLQMCNAEGPEEFWRYSVLFLKVVDGRYDYWVREYGDKNEAMTIFFRGIENGIKRQTNRWSNKRKKKLFGGDTPKGIFALFFGTFKDEEPN